jgi:hypothetical protein
MPDDAAEPTGAAPFVDGNRPANAKTAAVATSRAKVRGFTAISVTNATVVNQLAIVSMTDAQ